MSTFINEIARLGVVGAWFHAVGVGIADLIAAGLVVTVTAAGIAAAEWLRRRGSVEAAQAQARRDAASGVTAARLRHPSNRAKEQTWNS